jgi:hypothetical protein
MTLEPVICTETATHRISGPHFDSNVFDVSADTLLRTLPHQTTSAKGALRCQPSRNSLFEALFCQVIPSPAVK